MNTAFPSTFKLVTKVIAFVALCGLAACSGSNGSASHTANDKNVVTFTKDNFQAEVISSSQPVLVDFWATWCGPCRVVAPTVAALATEYEGRVKVGKVDVDTQQELAKEYKVTGIPALMIFKDGKVVEQFIGVRSKSELKSALDKVAAPPKT